MADDFKYSGRNAGAAKPYAGYASLTITVSGAQTDYSLLQYTTLFDSVTSPAELLLRNGSSMINIKFNSTNNNSIPVYANTDFGVQGLSVSDVFITCSGNATFDIFTLGWK
jgi:hypothetical protein